MKPGVTASQVLIVPGGGLAPLVAARFWRIDVTETDDGDSVSIRDIELRETLGGADATAPADAPTKALASSELSGFYLAEYAFDATGDAWSSADPGGLPGWIQWDFGVAVLIQQVAITVPNNTQGPREFTVQISDDGVTFSTVYAAATQPTWALGEQRVFDLA